MLAIAIRIVFRKVFAGVPSVLGHFEQRSVRR